MYETYKSFDSQPLDVISIRYIATWMFKLQIAIK